MRVLFESDRANISRTLQQQKGARAQRAGELQANGIEVAQTFAAECLGALAGEADCLKMRTSATTIFLSTRLHLFVDGIIERLRPTQKREAVLVTWAVFEDGRKNSYG
jgi:uncharacterized MAPEG superfamily protein